MSVQSLIATETDIESIDDDVEEGVVANAAGTAAADASVESDGLPDEVVHFMRRG